MRKASMKGRQTRASVERTDKGSRPPLTQTGSRNKAAGAGQEPCCGSHVDFHGGKLRLTPLEKLYLTQGFAVGGERWRSEYSNQLFVICISVIISTIPSLTLVLAPTSLPGRNLSPVDHPPPPSNEILNQGTPRSVGRWNFVIDMAPVNFIKL